jgi:hypothetical protein
VSCTYENSAPRFFLECQLRLLSSLLFLTKTYISLFNNKPLLSVRTKTTSNRQLIRRRTIYNQPGSLSQVFTNVASFEPTCVLQERSLFYEIFNKADSPSSDTGYMYLTPNANDLRHQPPIELHPFRIPRKPCSPYFSSNG